MGALNNLYVSSSFQGLMKLTNSATGLTNSLQTIQAGDGSDSPLQMSLTQVNISGSLTVNGSSVTAGTSGTSGSNGTDGSSGSSGSNGTDGSSGSSGSNGTNGSSGTSGSNGTDGSSGSSGSNGTDGTSGSNGTDGTSGSNGTDGTSGTDGSSGSNGTDGTSGSNGTDGTSGSNGTDGTSGSNGTDGTSGSNGTDGSSGTSGIALGLPAQNIEFTQSGWTWDGSTYSSKSFTLSQPFSSTDYSIDVQYTPGSNPGLGQNQYWGDLTEGTLINFGWNITGKTASGFTLTITTDVTQTVFSGFTGYIQCIALGASNGSGSSGTSGTSGLTDKTGLITTGSISTTQSITGSLIHSGSSTVIGFTNMSGSLWIKKQDNTNIDYVTESGVQSNIYFGQTQNSSVLSGSYFVSGSNNLLLSQLVFSPTTMGYINGSSNIGLGSQISMNTSSLLQPTTNNNNINSSVALTFTTSSLTGGQPSISTNIINASQTFNHPSSSLAMSNNVLNAGVTSTSNLTTHTVRPTFQNNIVNHTLALNQFSSSVLTTNNIIGGSTTINNSYFQTGSNNSITLAANIFGGQTTVINVAGNPQTNVSRPIVGNLIGGSGNSVSAQITGSDLGGLRNTAIWGFQLVVTGSHSAAQTTTQGAAFFGRWNSEADGLADSARTVFAVGTGTATGASRKTGLYVTSGSIVGVSGSMLVQGNSNFTGSVNISGSLQVASTSSTILGTLNTTNQNIGQVLSFTGSRFTPSVLTSTDLENTNQTQFVFNQLNLADSLTGTQLKLNTDKSSNNVSVQLNTRYSGQSDANVTLTNTSTGDSSFIITADSTSLQNTTISGSLAVTGNILFSSGSNKTMGTVALDGANPGSATISNTLVTTSSLIFLTKQTNNHPNAGPVVVSSKGTGTFSITSNHNGDTDTVAYQIINPA